MDCASWRHHGRWPHRRDAFALCYMGRPSTALIDLFASYFATFSFCHPEVKSNIGATASRNGAQRRGEYPELGPDCPLYCWIMHRMRHFCTPKRTHANSESWFYFARTSVYSFWPWLAMTTVIWLKRKTSVTWAGMKGNEERSCTYNDCSFKL
jgi:hypothetical protein